MINQADVGEWIREVTERPESAPLIIQEVARRLVELEKLNEKLRTENLALSTKHRIQQYQDRIAELEYQLEIMGKHLVDGAGVPESPHLLVYNPQAQLLKLALPATDMASGAILGRFSTGSGAETEGLGLRAVYPQDELLLLFASGRTATLPAADIPLGQEKDLNWAAARDHNLPQGDVLIDIRPISKMSIFAYAIQTSRLGYARRIAVKFLQRYITQNNIGQGTTGSAAVDRPAELTFCQPDDLLVVVSRQGYVLSVTGEAVPVVADRALKLDPDDTVVTAFNMGRAPSLVAVSQEGRAMRYPATWLKPAEKLGGRGQSLWSKSKREAGIRLVGAGAAGDDDWGVGLKANGHLIAVKINEIPPSNASKKEHLLKNIYPFDLLAFTIISFNPL